MDAKKRNPPVKSTEFIDVSGGYILVDITATGKDLVTLGETPSGTDPVFTFEGEIRDRIGAYAKRNHITFEKAVRRLAAAWLRHVL